MKPADVDDRVELWFVDVLVVRVWLQDPAGVDLSEVEPGWFRLHLDRRVANAGSLDGRDLKKIKIILIGITFSFYICY